MPAIASSLVLGTPTFADAQQAALARAGDTLGAWTAALALGAANAAKGVTGSFAVALEEASGRVFLAVDRFAVHTLCYRIVDGRLRFAERADALADRAGIDSQAIYDYLYFHAIPSPRTVYAGVLRLPPGHYALFEHGRLTVAPYWTPEFQPLTGAVSFDALRDEFRQLLRKAVTAQLDGGKPACFLSGGTDSSTVAGMLREVAGSAATFSIGFEAEGYDEMAYARLAARHFGTEHHEYYVTPDDLVQSIPKVAAWYDQPFGNSSALPSYHCARMAQEHGVSKLLAGDGGDELFGGNTRYAKQRVFGWYDAIPPGLRSAVLEPLAGVSAVQRLPLVRKAASYVDQARVPMPDRLQSYNLLLRLGQADILTPAFLAQVDPLAPAHQQREVWAEAKASTLIDRMLAFDWRYTLAEVDLPKVGGTTRLAGVAVGYPMLDDDLLAFSMRLPPAYKLKGFTLRWFFKEALRGFLPDEILVKKKQGFGLPFGVWMMRHAGLRKLATESLGSLSTRNIVRPEFIPALLDQRMAEHPAYYGEMVWILMMLEQWMLAKAPDFKLPR